MCVNSGKQVCTEPTGTEWNGAPLFCKPIVASSILATGSLPLRILNSWEMLPREPTTKCVL